MNLKDEKQTWGGRLKRAITNAGWSQRRLRDELRTRRFPCGQSTISEMYWRYVSVPDDPRPRQRAAAILMVIGEDLEPFELTEADLPAGFGAAVIPIDRDAVRRGRPGPKTKRRPLNMDAGHHVIPQKPRSEGRPLQDPIVAVAKQQRSGAPEH